MDRPVDITPALVTGKVFALRSRLGRYAEPSHVTEAHYPRYDWTCQGTEFGPGECLFARSAQREPANRAQTFHLFRVSAEHVMIAPRDSTGVLDYAHTAWNQISKPIVTWEPHGADNQLFTLVRTGDGDNPVRIQSRHGGMAIEVWYRSTGADGWLVGENPAVTDRQLFDLEVVDEVPLHPLQRGTGEVLGLGTDVVPRLRRLNEALPSQVPDPAVLIGETYVPFFAVTDPHLRRAEQARRSPYYVLRREQAWKKTQYDKRLGPGQGFDETMTVGITRELEMSLEQTLHLELSATAGATYKAVTASLGPTVSANLRLYVRTHEVYTATRTTRFHLEPSNRTTRVVWWHLVDRYTLLRTDGTIAQAWEILVPGMEVRDSVVAD